jgi:hypothetical protein
MLMVDGAGSVSRLMADSGGDNVEASGFVTRHIIIFQTTHGYYKWV